MKKVGFFKSIHVKLVIIYVLLILIAMQVMSVYFTNQVESQLIENHLSMLDERAKLIAYNVEQEMRKERDETTPSLRADIDALLRDLFAVDNADVQIIDKNKVVLSTSNFQKRQNVGQRTTEVRVKRALVGIKAADILRDPQTSQRMRVLAIPIKSENQTIGAVYIEASLEDIYEQVQQVNTILMTGTIIALVITVLLGILLARTITRPILDMHKQAKVMGKGDFTRKVRVYGKDEIGQLASAFNELTQKLMKANATTEEEKRKLKSVLSNMTDGVLATDPHGEIILMNKQAETLLNVNQEEVIGKCSILELLEVKDTKSMEDLYQCERLLLDFSDADTKLILEVNFSVIQKEEQEVNGLIIIIHDVTEEERIETARRQFVANVSHELRTPLTSMKSYLEALQDGALHDPTIAPKFLQVAQTETERMIRLVNDLLQLSKMDQKDYKPLLETVDVARFLHKIIDRFEMVSNQESLYFKREIPKKGVLINIDRDKMIQVFDNILSNAIKYSPEGGTITISLKKNKENYTISVSDQGVGIPQENISQIFNRFYRVDKARSRKLGGTGLGLAIAKEIIVAHGGKIFVESEWDVGTTFSIILPCASNGVKNYDRIN